MTRLLLAIASVLLVAVSATAQPPGCSSQLCNGKWIPCNQSCTPSGGSSSSSRSTNSAPTLTRNQQLAIAQNVTGNNSYELRDWNNAIRYYQLAHRNWPQDQVITQNLASAYNQAGNAACDSKDWAGAAKFYLFALQILPKSDVYRHNLGNVQAYLGYEAFNRGDWETAISFTRESLKNIPSDDSWVASLRERLQTATQNLQAAKSGLPVATQSDNERQAQAAEAEKQRQRDDAATAGQMRETIRQVSSSVVSSPAASTSGLEFKEMNAPRKDTGDSKSPSNLTFGDSTAPDKQLKSAATSDDPRKPFDDRGGNASGGLDFMTVDARQSGQQNVKAVSAAVLKSEPYKQLQKDKAKLEDDKQKLSTKLDEIQQKLDTGPGDKGALAVERAEVKNEISTKSSEIAKKQIDMEDYAATFKEDPVAPKDEKTAAPNGEKPVKTPDPPKPH